MVLDIGHRSTGLVFLEGEKVFTRNIAVAGLAITQEIQKNLNCTYQEGENLKLHSGFVALGGTYAVTDDERADRLSKIIRTVVTRLHAEVSRSINFYRSQQGGSAPTRILLCGASSLLPYMDQFFADKFQVPVEYFNPFATIAVDPGANLDLESANQIVTLANTVGLALRHVGAASLEMNLLPPTIVARKAFRRRVPFFILSAVAVLVSSFLWYRDTDHRRAAYEEQQADIGQKVQAIDAVKKRIDGFGRTLGEFQGKADVMMALAANRAFLPQCLEAIRRGLPKGAWLRSFRVRDVAEGGIASFAIEGFAFENDLEEAYRSGAIGMDKFTKALVDKNPTLFAGVSDLRSNVNKDLREFSFILKLAAPIGNPTVLRATASDAAEEE